MLGKSSDWGGWKAWQIGSKMDSIRCRIVGQKVLRIRYPAMTLRTGLGYV
jgi:hypothetical protein